MLTLGSAEESVEWLEVLALALNYLALSLSL
jgi:hypothetical protein